MIRYAFIISILCLMFCVSANMFGQAYSDSTVLYQIEMNDGNKFIGFIVSEGQYYTTFKSLTYGRLELRNDLIKAMQKLNNTKSKSKSKTQVKPFPDTLDVQCRIETLNGNEYIGDVKRETEDSLALQTNDLGLIILSKLDIKKRSYIKNSQFKLGEYWMENPQSARYFWAPNGYGLKKGEGYYQNVWVLFNQISYAPSKYFSLGIGTLPLFLFGGVPTPVWVTPKFSVPVIKDKLNVGAGILAGSVLGEPNASFGISYGVLTYGNHDANLTGGFGWAFSSNGWVKSPTFTIGGMARLSRRGYFITENYYINFENEAAIVLAMGGRSVWPKLSLDYGLIAPIIDEMDSFVLVPWLGFVIPIGNNN